MRIVLRLIRILPRFVALIAFTFASVGTAESVTLVPTQDASLYQSQGGVEVSNGAGQFLFAGRTFQGLNGLARRAVVRFDLAAIPSDARITGVRLSMNLVQLQGGPSEIRLHRATSAWTTGASDPAGNEGQGAPVMVGDCTWIFASAQRSGGGTSWRQPGGDFYAVESASVLTIDSGLYEWSSRQLIDDVQFFLNNPSANHGWFVLGDESQPGTARRFDSGDAEIGLGTKPVLAIDWTREALPCPGDLNGNGIVDGADLAHLLNQWGTSDADVDGDGTTDSRDLALLLGAWGTCP